MHKLLPRTLAIMINRRANKVVARRGAPSPNAERTTDAGSIRVGRNALLNGLHVPRPFRALAAVAMQTIHILAWPSTKGIRKSARESLNRLRHLAFLTKREVILASPGLRRFAVRVALIQFWDSRVRVVIIAMYAVIAFGTLFALPIFLTLRPDSILRVPSPYPQEEFTRVGLAFSASTALFGLMFAFVESIPKRLPPAGRLTLAFFPLFVLLIAALLLLSRPAQNGVLALSMLSAVLGNLLFMVDLLTAMLLLGFAGQIFQTLCRRMYPDAFIADGLLGVASTLITADAFWMEVAVRRNLIRRLEAVARCFQDDLPKSLKAEDPATEALYKLATAEMAAAIRAKKLQILDPSPGSRQQFLRTVANTILGIARGDWSRIDRREPAKIPIVHLWEERLKIALRTVVVVGAPIALLWAIQASPLAFSAPLADYAVGAAILWALLSLISALDPLYGTKLESVKGIINLVPGLNRGT